MIAARIHVELYHRFLKLFPAEHRARYGDDQLRLFADLLSMGRSPWRLWAGAVPDLAAVVRTTPRRSAVSHLSRLALYPLSMLNTAAGLTLAAIAALSDAVPMWVAVAGAAIAIQGLYALAWLTGRIPFEKRLARHVLVFGEAATLIVGTVGFVGALIFQAGTTDPEFGPPTMLLLIAVHGLIGLAAPGQGSPERATT